MAYGHAERTLAAIRLLEAETAALLAGLPELDAEQSEWLYQVAAAAGHDARRSGAEAGRVPVRLRLRLGGAAGSAARRGGCHG